MKESSENLYAIFKTLKISKNNELLIAHEISDQLGSFIACNQHGAPVFLIKIEETPPYRPSRNLKYLTITYHVHCRIKTLLTETTADFIAIECKEDFPDLFELFITSCHALLNTLPEETSTVQIQDHLQHLIDLFMKLSIPSGRSIAGLWAELLIIANSASPVYLLKVWHNSQYEKFDFANQAVCLEVKATELPNRVHDFSLEQISENSSQQEKYVASIKLRKIADGLGVLDLAKKISDQIVNDSKLTAKLWNIIASTLGTDFSDKLDISFDEIYSLNSIMVFQASDIPSPIVSNIQNVFDIRFKSNLSNIESNSLGGMLTIDEVLS